MYDGLKKVLDCLGMCQMVSGRSKLSLEFDGIWKMSDGLWNVTYGLGMVSDGFGKVSEGLGKLSDCLGRCQFLIF